jgi:DNA-binding response OmpR family regulator/HPt (histidine-containing phosphotransfer) domain-containing protein
LELYHQAKALNRKLPEIFYQEMKLLIVDDDRNTTAALSACLTAQQFTVDIACDGRTALQLVEATTYDLIVLDVMLPEVDGISLCQKLRQQHYHTPILLLTAKNRVSDRVAGLEAGADDYLTKPYDPSELIARIRALLRRSNTTILTKKLCWGALQLDPNACEVTYHGIPIKLTPKEYKLLELFLRYPRRIFDRRTLLDRVWSIDECPGEEAVTTQIRGLRRKLQAAGVNPDPIETLYGLGYRLRACSEQSSQPSARLAEIMQKMWHEFQERLQQQLAILDAAIQNLTPKQQQQAQEIAHRLVGSLGVYGMPQAANLARQIEQAIAPCASQLERQTLTNLLQQLRFCTAQFSQFPTFPPAAVTYDSPTAITILAIDEDLLMLEELQSAASFWGFRLVTATDPTTARQRLQSLNPDAVILDLSFPHAKESGFTLLAQLQRLLPEIPILVLTAHSELSHRIEAIRLGAKAFLHKPATSAEVFQALNQLLNRVNNITARILIVDDDASLLSALQNQLQTWGLQVKTLADPLQFWQVLENSRPDLLLLDVSMPNYNGIELCQAVRCDPRWSQLPILFLSARGDADTVHQALLAGADDYILKPIAEADLRQRLLKRLRPIPVTCRQQQLL